jgi:hypothetical protein
MPIYRLKVWTGPASVVALGRKLRRAGLRVPPFVFGQAESKSNPIGAAVSVLLVVGVIAFVFMVVGEPGK